MKVLVVVDRKLFSILLEAREEGRECKRLSQNIPKYPKKRVNDLSEFVQTVSYIVPWSSFLPACDVWTVHVSLWSLQVPMIYDKKGSDSWRG